MGVRAGIKGVKLEGLNLPKTKHVTQKQKEQMIAKLGSLLHDEWRAPRKKEDGTYEPRIKETKDKKWITSHGTNKVDIANTSFAELPSDWQEENRVAAEVAVNLVVEADEAGTILDEAFIEKASAVVHEKWLERNGEWAPEELKKPYKELPEEEKEKDRAQIKKAIVWPTGYIQWTVRPYVQGMGCDGTVDGNINLLAFEYCKRKGIDYYKLLKDSYPDVEMSRKDFMEWIEEVRGETVIPDEIDRKKVLDDLEDINYHSLLEKLNDMLVKMGEPDWQRGE